MADLTIRAQRKADPMADLPAGVRRRAAADEPTVRTSRRTTNDG
jgi:hypothetical protein